MSKKGIDTELLPTLSNEELANTLAMTPVRVAHLEDTVAQSPRSTIQPDEVRLDSVGMRALARVGEARHIAEGLVIGATLGEGGMGLVRLAQQRSLGRQVAVKTLKPDAVSERATLRLLREAWVTGSLEHPNIVPVYDLGVGEDGTPLIVLKLIEGSPWSDVVHDQRAKDGEDLLEKNLRIFVQVCNAVSLAHARGVIHRDLKLENVMIGRFGEVYLVDWGIALSLRPDPTGRLPLASEATEMAGTPAYMAPEMLGNGAPLTERTDIYLLGSVLHELLVGKPPHAADNLRAILASIVQSNIVLPPSVPSDLAAIVLRACARDPNGRYASVEELKNKVEWYLRHRGSLALSEAAGIRVTEMNALLARGGEPDRMRERLHHLFAEVRFGFRQAVLASSDNDVAKEGLRYATRLVVDYELTSGNAEAAASALAELDEAPPDLAERVAVALKNREAEKQRVADLETMSAQLDKSVGQRTRMAAGLMIGASWVVSPLVGGYLFERFPTSKYWILYAITVSQSVFGWLILKWGAESFMKTLINRRTAAMVMAMFALQLTLELSCKLLGMPWQVVLPLHIFVWFVSTVFYAVLVERRFWASASVYLVALLWSCLHPGHVFFVMAFCAMTTIATVVVAWMNPREDTAFFLERVKERGRKLM